MKNLTREEYKIKKCTRCGNEYPATEEHFNRDNRIKNGHKLRAHCRECQSKDALKRYLKNKDKYDAKNREWRKNNPDWFKDWHLKRNYGFTLREYKVLFKKQKGKCVICGLHQDKLDKPLYVDHCHRTGRIRGLLCNHCNSGLGMLKDDPKILMNGYNYLTNGGT